MQLRDMEAGVFEKRDSGKSNRIVLAYTPIFREKLKKLEERGLGRNAEASSIRRTLVLVDAAQKSHPKNLEISSAADIEWQMSGVSLGSPDRASGSLER